MPSYTGKSKGGCTMARVVIAALGFPSFRHIAAVASINHQTCAGIFYKKQSYEFAHKSPILRLYQVVYEAWQKKKFGFTSSEFSMYRIWLNEWRGRLLSKTLTRRPGQRLPNKEMKYKGGIVRRAKREAKRIAQIEAALRRFE